MNAERRKQLSGIVDKLDEVREELEAVKEDEETAFENMPESLQSSERGEAMQSAIDVLTDASETLEYALNELQGLVE